MSLSNRLNELENSAPSASNEAPAATVSTRPCPAVLFLVFNRPATTARVFEAIRAARPARLYVAADGARPTRDNERALVAETRKIALAVDWPCELVTLLREDNLGCKRAVSSAISWFFEHEAEGIILEDDCLPTPDFFHYCAELLDRYRDDERIGLIAGTSLFDLQEDKLRWSDEDYVFSRYFSIWGWACWRRVWRDYDVTISAWPTRRVDVAALTHDARMNRINASLFDRVHRGDIDTWDYQVGFMMWSTSRLAITPPFNLVDNLGFGPDATHTTNALSNMAARAKASTQRLSFPLIAPSHVLPNRAYQLHIERMASRSVVARLIDRLRQHGR